jgi:hypothetical protein
VRDLDDAVAAFARNGAAGSKGAGALIPPVDAFNVPGFLDMGITPRRYVLEPWLREKGLAMIHAQAGIGKTWFGLYCATAISTGETFLKWRAPEPLRVVYLDGEMAAQDLQDRLRTTCRDRMPAPEFFKIVPFDLYDGPVPNLATEDGQERLAPVIEPANVVFVDNLSCLAFDGDRSDAESWEVIQPWLLTLRRKGKSVVLFHHSGKTGTQRGTSRRTDALDTVIRLDRPPHATATDGCRFSIEFEKSRGQLGEAGQPFEAVLRDGVWTMKGDDLDQMTVVADLTLAGKSIRQIAAELGLPRTTVNRLQQTARRRGLL